MWRRILLAAVLGVFLFCGFLAAGAQSWAGFEFAKSMKYSHLLPVSLEEDVSSYGETAASSERLAPGKNPLPDSSVIPPLKQHFEYVLPGTCVSAISAGKDFKCTGRDKDHLVCSGMVVTVHDKVEDCLQINVLKEQ